MLRLLSIQGESDRTETTNTWRKDTKQYNTTMEKTDDRCSLVILITRETVWESDHLFLCTSCFTPSPSFYSITMHKASPSLTLSEAAVDGLASAQSAWRAAAVVPPSWTWRDGMEFIGSPFFKQQKRFILGHTLPFRNHLTCCLMCKEAFFFTPLMLYYTGTDADTICTTNYWEFIQSLMPASHKTIFFFTLFFTRLRWFLWRPLILALEATART